MSGTTRSRDAVATAAAAMEEGGGISREGWSEILTDTASLKENQILVCWTNIIKIKAATTTVMEKFFQLYCLNRHVLSMKGVEFRIGGLLIKNTDTCGSLGLNNPEEVYLIDCTAVKGWPMSEKVTRAQRKAFPCSDKEANTVRITLSFRLRNDDVYDIHQEMTGEELAKEICQRNCLALMDMEFTHNQWRLFSDDVVKTRGIKSRDHVWARSCPRVEYVESEIPEASVESEIPEASIESDCNVEE
jgi:hypothetical protein